MASRDLHSTGAAAPSDGGERDSSLRVFLNYRREDSSGYAGRLYDDLSERLASCDLFIDIDRIEPGADFVDVIDHALDGCDVVLAVIGKHWLSVTDSQGRRRLDDPDDYVRLELEAALARGMRLIPVRVQGADMPSSTDLPESLRGIARRQAVELSDHRWRHDVDTLSGRLEQLATEMEERAREERERLVREEAERLRAAEERAERERHARALIAAEEAARQRTEEEQAAYARTERERAAREKAEREKEASKQAERERKEREQRERAAAKDEQRRRKEQERREREAKEGAGRKRREHQGAVVAAPTGTTRSPLRRAALMIAAGVTIVAVAALAVTALRGGETTEASAAPAATGKRGIAGTPRAGNTLTVRRGSWQGAPTGFAYRWQRCNGKGGACKPIAGATARVHRLGAGDVGHRLRVAITATNEGGSSTVTTKPTVPIAAAYVAASSARRPAVSGSTVEGSTLRAVPGVWKGTRPIERTYVWLRCAAGGTACTTISGAQGTTYTLGPQDVNRRIRVEERVSNVAGRTKARSAPSGVVDEKAAADPGPTPGPTPKPKPDPEPVCPPDCPEIQTGGA